MGASILGLSHELPPRKDVGGVSRPVVASPSGPSELAYSACAVAFSEAGWSPESVEMIVFATMTPDVTFPGAGCFLQDSLGCATVGALDVRGQCSGFLMGLAVANDLIEAGKYERILLAAAEVHSSAMDESEAGQWVSSLYGDGGAVLALGREPGFGAIRKIVCGSEGRHHQRFWVEFPACGRYPTRVTVDDLKRGGHYLQIDRDHVSEFGREKLPQVVGEVLELDGSAADEVDVFIVSHIFPEVAADAAAALSIPAERLIVASEENGHLTAASLPVAFDQARRDGRIGTGARVCLATCGAGYTWGAALLECE